MITKKIILLIFGVSAFLYSQDIKINKIEPPNWWAGMNLNKVQLMIYGENLNNLSASFPGSKIKVTKINKDDSAIKGTYAFIDIEIPSGVKPGTYKLELKNSQSKIDYTYPILKRDEDKKDHKGFTPEDIVYLIMPDRFADGDTSDNVIEGYDDIYDRTKNNARHGGDLKGIIDHLDYIKDMGFTTIWLTPVVENNAHVSYHGYSATDFYKVDPRFGTNELYKTFVSEAHKRGMKIILDHVANHIHINHPWMNDLPVRGWINGTEDSSWHKGSSPEITNHDKVAIVDIHSDKATLSNSTTGWFTDFLPDMNQRNPFMGKYIIQNTIWWMEFAGIDAIREDTYPYADPVFMAQWAKVILAEYPATNIVGEVWKGDPVFLSTYQEKSIFTPGFNSNLPAVTDFGLSEALRMYLDGSKDLQHVYDILAMDYAYHNPDNLLTFIDNHDIKRAMYTAKKDAKKVEIALQILLTTRGIPQIFYATEIGAVGAPDDGGLRTDYPGGFPGDTRNAFTSEGRTNQENEIFNLLKQLIQIRHENKALADGKLVHFPPRGNVYFYFRILGNEKIMVVVNGSKEDKIANLTLAQNIIDKSTKLIDLKTGKSIDFNGNSINIGAEEVRIYKLSN